MSKTFLTIGAGPGIGLATAHRFAKEGYRVILASRNAARLDPFASAFKTDGLSAETAQVDAADPHAIAELVRRIGARLKVLHYNASVLHYDAHGALQPRPIDAESINSLISDTQINIGSALTSIKAALPFMSQKSEASILLTGGGLGAQPSGDFLTLSVGKAGLRAIALALFEPLKRRNVHIATVTVSRPVSPDSTQTAEIAEAFWNLHTQPVGHWTVETVYR